jgi:hypothetical protein
MGHTTKKGTSTSYEVKIMEFAPEIPVVVGMAVDWAGRIWVERGGTRGPFPLVRVGFPTPSGREGWRPSWKGTSSMSHGWSSGGCRFADPLGA